jgi:hypothetical protein
LGILGHFGETCGAGVHWKHVSNARLLKTMKKQKKSVVETQVGPFPLA